MNASTKYLGRQVVLVFNLTFISIASLSVAAEEIESTDEESAIRELVRRGAVVKRFEVKETETTGQLVRFKTEHLDHNGCLPDELLNPLLRLPRVAVEFRGVPLTDAGLKRLALKARLIGLDVSGSRVTDRGLTELDNSELPLRKTLRLLDVSFTRITDEGLKSVGKLKPLRHISVIACPITDAGLESLSGLPKLRSAYLTRTRVTAAAVNRWRRHDERCRIEHDVATGVEP